MRPPPQKKKGCVYVLDSDKGVYENNQEVLIATYLTTFCKTWILNKVRTPDL